MSLHAGESINPTLSFIMAFDIGPLKAKLREFQLLWLSEVECNERGET